MWDKNFQILLNGVTVMKSLLVITLPFFFHYSAGQESINDILDKSIQQRVLLIKSRTDSLLNKVSDKRVYTRFVADFSVTYQMGKFYDNYIFLNKAKRDSNDIFDLTQYYFITDTSLGISDTIAICYLELRYQFAPEINSLEVRFDSNIDYLKIKALNYLYKPFTQERLKKLLKAKEVKNLKINISVDSNTNTYLVLIKDKDRPHHFPL